MTARRERRRTARLIPGAALPRFAIAAGLASGAAAAVVVAQALATPGSGAVSNYVARRVAVGRDWGCLRRRRQRRPCAFVLGARR